MQNIRLTCDAFLIHLFQNLAIVMSWVEAPLCFSFLYGGQRVDGMLACLLMKSDEFAAAAF